MYEMRCTPCNKKVCEMYTTKRGKAVENHRRTRSHNIKWSDWYESGDPNYQPVYEIIPVPKPEYRPVERVPVNGGERATSASAPLQSTGNHGTGDPNAGGDGR
jgi:hypothetical protein